jgi:hypothetical protein
MNVPETSGIRDASASTGAHPATNPNALTHNTTRLQLPATSNNTNGTTKAPATTPTHGSQIGNATADPGGETPASDCPIIPSTLPNKPTAPIPAASSAAMLPIAATGDAT